MQAWMILWTTLLVASCLSFLGLLLIVGKGAVREMRESLADLREDACETSEHPEILDETT